MRLLFLILLLSACGKIENSNSLDQSYYSEVPTGSEAFNAATSALRSKCMFCHTHAAWTSMTESDFLSSGLVLPQDYENSKIYYRAEGSSGTGGPKNMPTNGNPPLSSEELSIIQNWILSIPTS